MKKLFTVTLLLLLGICIFSQQDDKTVQITGNTLRGSEINGEVVREVEGDVVILQGRVKITCKKAIQFIKRNDFELMGSVVITKDTLTLYTEHGFYQGDAKIAYSTTGIVLNDTRIVLNALTGYYFMDDDRAEFSRDVNIIDKKTKMYSDEMTYYKKEEKVFARGNVKVLDTASTFQSDTLTYFRKTKYSEGYGNIEIFDQKNNGKLYGGKFINFGDKKYYQVFRDPFLMQIDTTDSGKLDTLFMRSQTMEIYNDSTSLFRAIDSVKIWRTEFSAKASIAEFYRKEDRIYTYKTESDSRPPVLWYEKSQMFGDTINIYTDDKEIKLIDMRNLGFILSQDEKIPERFNQLSGDSIKLYFSENELTQTVIKGSVRCIYYTYDDDKPNGLIKASSQDAKLFFGENKITDVKFYTSVQSEFHPENLIEGKEQDFTLPLFIIYSDAPKKQEFLNLLNSRKKR